MDSMLVKTAVEISHIIGTSTTGAYVLIGVILLFLVIVIISRS